MLPYCSRSPVRAATVVCQQHLTRQVDGRLYGNVTLLGGMPPHPNKQIDWSATLGGGQPLRKSSMWSRRIKGAVPLAAGVVISRRVMELCTVWGDHRHGLTVKLHLLRHLVAVGSSAQRPYLHHLHPPHSSAGGGGDQLHPAGLAGLSGGCDRRAARTGATHAGRWLSGPDHPPRGR